jgi:type I restriction enzyme S subunit
MKLKTCWAWKTLDDVSEKITDGTHHSPKVQHSEWEPGRFKYITSKNIKNNGMKLDDISYIDQDIHDEIYARCPPEFEDQLLTKDGAMTGTCCLNELNEPFSLLSSVALIKQKRSIILPKYLNYYLQSHVGQNFLLGDISGAAITRTNIKKLKSTPVPLAPYAEQERIVEKLDALLNRIDTAIENLQESIRLADALFSSALNRVFNPSGTKVNFDSCYGLPEGWDWRTVNDLSTKIQYGHTAKAADKGNAQFLRITDIQDNNIDWLGVPFVDLKEKEIEKYALKDNDLVFARSGATAGKSILIKEPPRNAIFASYLIRIVPDKETIQPEYLELFFKSPAYWDIVKANAAGAAQPNINGTKLGEFKVPTPSMEIQKRIVDEMSSLSARVTELKKELRDKVYFIESAKSSILNSAFKGEL